MKKIFILPLFLVILSYFSFSQNVGIGTATPNSSAQLDVSSTSKGVLISRMTTAQRKAIASPATGLLVFDLDKKTIYMYDGNKWLPFLFTTNENNLPASPIEATDGAVNDYFGWSVSISGDYAIVGAGAANSWQGSAYIFYRNGGIWTQQARLSASDGAISDQFGWSVSISGDYAIVGAVGANSNKGSAYVFYKGSAWTTGQPYQAKLIASDGAAGDDFGYSVSINGDYIIIGASYDVIGANSYQGSAYVFYKGSAWTTGQAHQAKLIASDGAFSDDFGSSVSINGDYAIIGSPNDAIGANSSQGSAYIYGRIGTSWLQLAKLTASDGAAGDYFGRCVSSSGDYIIVGAVYDDVGAADQGSAYIFYRGSGWTTGQLYQAKLIAYDGASSDYFGYSVSISGDYVIVSGEGKDFGSAGPDWGAAYIYKRNGVTWNFVRKITDDNGQANGNFSHAVSIDGFNLIIGEYHKNNLKGEVFFLNIE